MCLKDMRWILLAVTILKFSISCQGRDCSSLEIVLKNLEVQVHELQRLRDEDQETIRMLKQKFEARVKPDEGTEKLVSKDSAGPSESLIVHFAMRWLQNTVHDLRREMKEMASYLNTSANLAEKQKTETTLTLLRSDLTALSHRMDDDHLEKEKNAAVLHQVKQDVEELRQRLQQSAVLHTKLADEVRLTQEIASNDVLKESNAKKHHMRFRHGYWKAEVNNIFTLLQELTQQQKELTEKLRTVMRDQFTLETKQNEMFDTQTRLLNKENELRTEQSEIQRRLKELVEVVNASQNGMSEFTTEVKSSSTGIKKHHDSTTEILESLDPPEVEEERSILDLKMDMSRLDYKPFQFQSDMEEIRERQLATGHVLNGIKTDISSLHSEAKRNLLRILVLQSYIMNRTIQSSQYKESIDLRLSNLESRFLYISDNVKKDNMEIKTFKQQMLKKDNNSAIKEHTELGGNVKDFVPEMLKIIMRQDKIEEELKTFIQLLPKDCSSNSVPPSRSWNKRSMILVRSSDSFNAITVLCDMDTSGGYWTIIQKRSTGDESFEKNWIEYKKGFGNVASGDFWIGNDFLHKLTTERDYVLRIDLWDASGKYKYAEYTTFRVFSERDNYRLLVDGYKGNASDALSHHNGMAFSTPDRDNDASNKTHCAQFYSSGWWYNHCQYVNINGRYNTGITWYDIDGKEWTELSKVEMKIRLLNSF